MAEFTWSTRTTWILIAGAALVALLVGYNLWRIEVKFDSVPEGAVVRIDGRGIGLTPLTVALEPGRHRLELTHSHYVTFEETITVARGDRLRKTVQMQSGVGQLSLLSNPRGAWVEVDGRRLEGITPLEVAAPTGPTSIRMGLSERHVVDKDVIVLAGQTLEVNLELNIDPHGSLTVSVSPGDAKVTLPELDVAYVRGVRVPIGEQLIRITRPGYETQQVRFKVLYGDNNTRVTLTRALGAITVSTRPSQAKVSLTYDEAPGRSTTVAYQPGTRLPVGRVEVKVRAIGYRTGFKAIDLTSSGRKVSLTLEPMDVVAGETFRDDLASGGKGPMMVVIPPGEFLMGDPDGPPSVQPARNRTLSEPFALARFETTIAEFLTFAAATGLEVDDRLLESDEPARYLKWSDAVAYADWLTRETGAKYRLPSEAEWEYAARAGSSTDYEFGSGAGADADEICVHANLADLSTGELYREWDVVDCEDGFSRLAPVGSFPPNAFGLYDMHGNVTEWVLECGMPPYSSAADDGALVNRGQSCRTHGVRGGSWDSQAAALKSWQRGFGQGKSDDRGIRLLREL